MAKKKKKAKKVRTPDQSIYALLGLMGILIVMGAGLYLLYRVNTNDKDPFSYATVRKTIATLNKTETSIKSTASNKVNLEKELSRIQGNIDHERNRQKGLSIERSFVKDIESFIRYVDFRTEETMVDLVSIEIVKEDVFDENYAHEYTGTGMQSNDDDDYDDGGEGEDYDDDGGEGEDYDDDGSEDVGGTPDKLPPSYVSSYSRERVKIVIAGEYSNILEFFARMRTKEVFFISNFKMEPNLNDGKTYVEFIVDFEE